MTLISTQPFPSPLRIHLILRSPHRTGNTSRCARSIFVGPNSPVLISNFPVSGNVYTHSSPNRRFNHPQGYYRANHALARIARQISNLFWKPLIESDGIPLDMLRMVMDALYDWKAAYLHHVGVSGGLKGDFIGAISACRPNLCPLSL